ncbi:zinc finger protein 410 isoform X1 [Suricata suricatta]|uniref:Zinc finger protein 410 n=1 Tax=Suricata suricatta TaxID=37032 RepID=A0A673U7K7_SURSU|nr:zinc finger protein 410 isoform X1 [Suricata suricatta]XP_029808808.1 zinc finger protein 410 isoform X1 [Suricata suricatta]
MLSDELESKPELLVQFVQNTSIPLGQGLVESEAKDITCLSLLPVTEASECSRLVLPDDTASHTSSSKEVPSSAVLRSLQMNVGPDGEETRAQTVQKSPEFLSTPESPSLLQDLQPSDSTSFILLNLTRAGLGSSAEHLVFVQDEAEDSGNDFLSSESTDSSIPWFLRVQELAHDSLIAATRAQLAKNAKTSGNGENVHLGSGDGQPKDSGPLPQVEKKLKCTVEGCDRTFVWPAHFKYHLKTHRNDRSFICPAEGCGKSFYVLQRLKVHMRTHNGEKPFMCPESSCGKQFTTAGNLKNHLRIHTGEKPFLCEAQGCGRSFAEYSSLRKHLVVHSGEKPHQCQVCGKTFSQSGSRNVHMRKHHLQLGAAGSQEQEQTGSIQDSTSERKGPGREMGTRHSLTAASLSHPVLCAAEPLMGSSLLEEASVTSKNLVPMNPQPSLGGESLNLPNTNSILGVDDEVLTEGSPRPLSSVPDVTHHLVTMQSGRQSYEVSVLTAVNPQELLNPGDLTERRT